MLLLYNELTNYIRGKAPISVDAGEESRSVDSPPSAGDVEQAM